MKQKLLRMAAGMLMVCLCMSALAAVSAAGMTLNKPQTVVLSESSADPGLAAKSFTLSFEDEILVNLYYTVANPSSVTEHGMLVFREDPAVVSIDTADAVYNTPRYDAVRNRYMATADGIAAKEMGDSRYYAVYAKTADGIFYTKTYDYSPKKYALNMLGKDTTSEKQKKLCVAMLNYGAAAQDYFNYNKEDLMNATLTDDQKAMVKAYDKTLFLGAVAADPDKCGDFVKSGFSSRTATVSFEGAFCVNYYFTPSAAVAGEMTMYIWTDKDYMAAETLTQDNATQVKTMVKGDDGRYWGQVDDIAAKSLDQTYYVAGVYTDDQGIRRTTGIIPYSLSKYCISKAVSGNAMEGLAAATAMYGYYAAQYFAVEAPVSTDPTLTVPSLTAAPGATVELVVTMKNNPGIAGMTLGLEYDDSALTLTKVTSKEVLSGLTFQKPKTYKNGCNLVWYGVEPRQVLDGNAFVLTFTVSADAVPGDYPVKLTFDSGYDIGLSSVELVTVAGGVSVSG